MGLLCKILVVPHTDQAGDAMAVLPNGGTGSWHKQVSTHPRVVVLGIMSHNLRRPLTRYSLFTTRIRNFSSSHIPPNNPNDSPDDPAEWKKTLTRTREQLRLWGQIQSAALKERTESLSSNASVSLQTVGVKLNEVTGYHEIEALKKQVVDTGECA